MLTNPTINSLLSLFKNPSNILPYKINKISADRMFVLQILLAVIDLVEET